MSTSQNLKVNWTNVPTRTISAGGVEFAYRELGRNDPGTPVVFLVHRRSNSLHDEHASVRVGDRRRNRFDAPCRNCARWP
jgi:hypothetical protein